MTVQVDYSEKLTELGIWVIVTAIGMMLTCIFSFHLISQHLNNYVQPHIQTLIVRILFLPPIFVAESVLSVASIKTIAPYVFAIIRDGYEAYVIFLFLTLLMKYIGGEDALVAMHRDKPPVRLGGVIGFLSGPITVDSQFLLRVKRSILQFVYMKPIIAFIEFVVKASGHEAHAGGVDWLRILSLISLVIAMVALLQFYRVTVEDLKSFNPFLKFLCIKLVIFITLVQEFILVQALNTDRIESRPDFSSTEFAHVLQAFLVSFEMVAAAFSLHWAFPVSECIEQSSTGGQPAKIPFEASSDVFTAISCIDLIHETRDVLCCCVTGHVPSHDNAYHAQQDDQESVRMDKFTKNGQVAIEPPSPAL